MSWSQAGGAGTSEEQPPLETQTTAKREWGKDATASHQWNPQASRAGYPGILVPRDQPPERGGGAKVEPNWEWPALNQKEKTMI